MEKTFTDNLEVIDLFSDEMKRIYSVQLRMRCWWRHLPESEKAKYETMYKSFAENISVARADLGAVFAEYLVNSAGAFAEKEAEELS